MTSEEPEGNRCKKCCLDCLTCIEFGTLLKKDDGQITEEEKNKRKKERKRNWSITICFFILGLTNNFGYVAYNAGASDILSRTESTNETHNNARNCSDKSPGMILIAEILPGFFIKTLASFTPLYLHLRVGIVVLSQSISYVLVAFTDSFYLVIFGTVLISISSELGEATYLQFSSLYGIEYAVNGWSSGTGAAGVIGALGFHILIELTSYVVTFLSMLIIPLMMLLVYIFMPKPEEKSVTLRSAEGERPKLCEGFTRKVKMFPSLWFYLFPLAAIYLFEYTINQACFKHLTFANFNMNKSQFYRIYNILYQIGVFISRSSLLCVRIKYVWLMCILQMSNLIMLFFDAMWGFIPSFYIVSLFILFEGTLGGFGYVNTYHNMQVELTGEKKEFGVSISTLVNSIFICLAGVVSIPIFNFICTVPPFTRHIWF